MFTYHYTWIGIMALKGVSKTLFWRMLNAGNTWIDTNNDFVMLSNFKIKNIRRCDHINDSIIYSFFLQKSNVVTMEYKESYSLFRERKSPL
jgi:hypothetical protein